MAEVGVTFQTDGGGFGKSGFNDGEYAGGRDLDGDGVGDLLIGNGDWGSDAIGRIWMIPGGTLPLLSQTGLCDRGRGGQTDRSGGGQSDHGRGGQTDRSGGGQSDRGRGGRGDR